MSDKSRKKKVDCVPRKSCNTWSETEDTQLAEIVIQAIRENKRIGDAYREAGLRLTRTPGACQLRFNTVLRSRYQAEIQTAKRARVEIAVRGKRTSGEEIKTLEIIFLRIAALETQMQRITSAIGIQNVTSNSNDGFGSSRHEQAFQTTGTSRSISGGDDDPRIGHSVGTSAIKELR